MKKGQIIEGTVRKVRFPNTGIVETEEGEVVVKNVLPEQRVECMIRKKRNGCAQGTLLRVLEHSPKECDKICPHFDQVGGCGGCIYQTLPYEEQLRLKEEQVRETIRQVYINPENGENDFDSVFERIKPSPRQFEFRNKMEFSFGDAYKNGPISLGMHKRGGFYDIITVDECRLVDHDFRLILKTALAFATEQELSFYHRMKQRGYLRHLLVRKASQTGEILIALVTTSRDLRWNEQNGSGPDLMESRPDAEEEVLKGLANELCKLKTDGNIVGIVHIVNDSVADVVQSDRTELLFGQDWFYEQLLGLRFKITPFSFFQTNTYGAEVLYRTAREYCLRYVNHDGADYVNLNDGDYVNRKPVIFDLYSGTGTIAQIMASVADTVIGVEIVEEAVKAAVENAESNGLHNCRFIAGDVLKVLDEIDVRPDLIILDPPRDGIHPKALPKILAYGVENIVYISCKPTSLARDLVVMQQAGYRVSRICPIDMFPGTGHVETVVKLVNMGVKPDFTVHLDVDVDDFYRTVGEEKRHFLKDRESELEKKREKNNDSK